MTTNEGQTRYKPVTVTVAKLTEVKAQVSKILDVVKC